MLEARGRVEGFHPTASSAPIPVWTLVLNRILGSVLAEPTALADH